jgi:pyruvate, water dikinase
MTDLIAWMDRIPPRDAVGVAGPKMGRLAELTAVGMRVPRSFAVTVHAYGLQCDLSGLADFADRSLADLPDATDALAVEACAERIRRAYLTAEIVDPVRDAIATAYDELSDLCANINTPVAVRSSAAGEDSADASFAGAFDTFLGVSGIDAVLVAVRACWASLFTTRAVSYRLERRISHRDMPMAVGVVELVHARTSGVAFSGHPVTGKRDRVVIEASWGWGAAVVAGLVTPDHIQIDKQDRRVLRYDVASKDVVSNLDYQTGRVVERPMPANLRDRPALDDEQIQAVVDAVLRIEQHYGYPVDVEWVIDRHRRAGDPISVVQARPLTAAGTAAAPSSGWDPVAYAVKYAVGPSM